MTSSGIIIFIVNNCIVDPSNPDQTRCGTLLSPRELSWRLVAPKDSTLILFILGIIFVAFQRLEV